MRRLYRALLPLGAAAEPAAVQQLAASPAHPAVAKRGYSSSSVSGKPSWTEHCGEQFSLQPSYFSPLYSAHRRQQELDTRRQLAMKLLRAHYELAAEAEGYDAAQIQSTTMHRVSEMQKLAADLRALGQRTNIPACSSREHALGFYSILEEETAGHDADAEAFHAVVQGEGSIWQHWRQHFAQQYASAPGLELLHSVYARSERGGGSGGGAQPAGQLPTDGAGQGSPGRPSLKGKPSISEQGVSRATGMRKCSTADVRVVRGQGRIYINGRPLDTCLQDVSARMHVLQPFIATGTTGQFDVVAQVRGGGPAAMAQAVQHGIAKSLTLLLGSKATPLGGMTHWDPRQVERKKPGRKKARKGFAYVRR